MAILANGLNDFPFETPYVYLTTNIINFFDNNYLKYNSPAYIYTLTAVTGTAPLIELFSFGQWTPLNVGGTFQLTDLQNRNIRISYANMKTPISRFAELSFAVVNLGSYYLTSASTTIQLSAVANISTPAQQYTSARRITTDGKFYYNFD